MDCSQGKLLFNVGDSSDFGVSEEGAVYTLRHLSLEGKEKTVVVVYAQDVQSKQIWKARLHLHIHPNGHEQVQQQIFFHHPIIAGTDD